MVSSRATAIYVDNYTVAASVYIFIHNRRRGSHDTADIKGSRPTARPLLLSRQRRHFGAPSGSVRRCRYQFV